PFTEAALSQRFVYDTDPAARAVVLVRRLAPERALAFLHRVQRAFYAEGRDVTSHPVLGELAAELGLPADQVQAALSDETLKQETWSDYAMSQGAGVSGFPTLVGGPNEAGVYGVVTRGCAPAAQILATIDDWLARADEP
ncbi:MAG TPA: DsbA family protein, partial [Phenylobacterium sp.]